LAHSSASTSSGVLTLQLALSFRGSFGGARTIFAEMLAGGVSTGYQSIGTYAVTPGNSPPTVDTTAAPVFRFHFTDPAGATDILRTQMLIGASLRADAGCLVYFDRPSGVFYLLNDAGAAFTTGSPTIQNSQCTLDVAHSTAVASANELTVTLALTFPASFNGPRRIYAEQYPINGPTSGYYEIGATNIGGLTGISIANVTNAAGQFTINIDDAAGFADVARVQLLLTNNGGAANACLVYYNRAANQFLLLNDAGAAFQTALDNSQCTVNAASATVTGSGTRLTVSVPVTFKPAFTGAKSIYAEAFSNTFNLSTGYKPFGTAQ
jgi:hypothetical protein